MTEIRTSEQINDIAAALAKAQAEMENVAKDKENPHFRARYATLAGVLEEVRPKLARQGISIFQAPANGDGNNIGIATRLLHSSGQWMEAALYVQPTKFDAQGVGSVLTYLRRYTLMAVAGVGPEDDDGNAAVGKPQGRTQAATPQSPPAARTAPPAATHGDLPPTPEEPPGVGDRRAYIKGLIDTIADNIAGAKNSMALDAMWDQPSIKTWLTDISAAGPNGKDAAYKLRSRYMARSDQLRDAESLTP